MIVGFMPAMTCTAAHDHLGTPELRQAFERARSSDRTTVVYVQTDPLAPVPSSPSWWDGPVSEVSALDSTQKARAASEAAQRDQRLYL
jgi:3D-(3,5/4)-trihydroxycyclohexane-1,2-dione acylhydrolase (decyclizing)